MKFLFKILIGLFVFIITILIILVLFSYTHQDEIEITITDYINSRFENKIHIEEFHLSYIRNFPNARLTLSNVVLSDDTEELLKVGSIKVFFDIRDFLRDSVSIKRIAISDGILQSIIDENGNKPKFRFSEGKTEKKDKGKSVHIFSPAVEIYNLKLVLLNLYKKNETYVTINECFLNLDIYNELITISGNLKGHLDSLKSNKTTLFADKPALAQDMILKINTGKGLMYLEKGHLKSNSLSIKPTISFKKHEDGNIVKLRIETGGNLDEILNFLNLPEGFDVKQLNKDATVNVSYNQDGFVNPVTRPYNLLKFDIRNAQISNPNLQYPIKNIHIIGNYNNGELHIPESNNLIIDTLQLEVEHSSLNASLHLTNLKDPIVNGHFISDIDLNHIFDNDKLSAVGSIYADLHLNGKISELRTIHPESKKQGFGEIQIDSLDVYFKESGNRLRIPFGHLSLNNHIINIREITGEYNDSHFSFDGVLHNLDHYLLKENTLLSGNINVYSDKINLQSFSASEDSLTKEKGNDYIPDIDLNFRFFTQHLEGNFGSLDNLLFSGNLKKEMIQIDTLQFNFQDGIIKSDLYAKYNQEGIQSVNGTISGDFNYLNFDELFQPKEENQKASSKTKLPEDIDIDIDLSIQKGLLKGNEVSNVKIDAKAEKGNLELNTMEASIFNGSIQLSSNIKYNDKGIWYIKADGKSYFNHLSIEELMSGLKNTDTERKDNKEIVMPEIVDIKLRIQIDSLEYGQNVFDRITTGLNVSRDEIDIEDFTIDFDEGHGEIDLQIIDYMQKDNKIKGNVLLSLDTIDIDAFHEAIGGFSTNKDHHTQKAPVIIPDYVNIHVDINADLIKYKELEIRNLNFSNTLSNGVFSIAKLDFNTAGGDVHLSGILIQNEDLTIDGHLYSKGKRLSIKPLIASFSDNSLTDGSHGDFEGYLSYNAEGLFKTDSLTNFITDENLFYADIFLEEAKIIDNPEIDKSLSFVGHKARENILINDSEFQIFMDGSNLMVRDILVNNSISDMNIFGKMYRYDSAINLDFRISLTDLFFRSKKERYVDTSKGKIRLFKDLSLFIEYDGTSEDHKIKVHAKRKHKLRKKELIRDIEQILQKYRTRMNAIYLKAVPKLEETNPSLKALNN